MTRRLWPWLRTLIAVAIMAVLVWRLGTEAFLDGLRLVDGPAMLAALGIGLFTTVLSVWRWCLVAGRLGLPLPPLAALADYYRSLFLNAALPAGILGDAHRAVVHGRYAGDVGRAVRAVVLERTGGQIVLVAAGAVVLIADPSPAAAIVRDVVPNPWAAAGVLTLIAALIAVAVRIRRTRAFSATGRGGERTVPRDDAERTARPTGPGETTPAGGRWAAIKRSLAASAADLRAGLLARDTWPPVFALSAAVLAGHVTMFVVAARTAGSDAPVGRLLPIILLTLLVMAVPVNVGGWGPREAFAATAFGAVGLGTELGLTTSVVYGVLALVAGLPGAVVLLLGRGTRADRGEAVPEPTADRGALAPVARALALQDGKVLGERLDQAVEHVLPLAGRSQ
ncbi:lysylphosphatidylglycerol synthase transmembrane domain-containing protein [Thermopolyspora sp. NPDC052614]|uniref:lysylphosphatidylglycerol synthase transmembrane domain-containing protein n=1 Tax=Thermopolyspora sp. NPDC052614 TaxID=3155682 RepID=UPI0034319208